MFGCHNCGKRPEKGEKYEKTACAHCRAAADPSVRAFYPADEIALQRYQVMHPAYEEEEEYSPEFLMMQGIINALSQTIEIMLSLKESNPETYKVVEAKMKNPLWSYSQLAAQLDCKKQNIEYHLKKAMRLCPAISFALIIDPRFSNGIMLKERYRKLYLELGLGKMKKEE